MNVVALVGSLRQDSLNARLAAKAIEQLPAGTHATVWDRLGELPFYNEDLDGEAVPAVVTELREAVAAADGLVVVTPEYNGSVSGVLKNAIDWLSRPRGEAALAGMPTVVLAASMSPRGAQWAREDAVKILGVAGADVRDHLGIPDAHQHIGVESITEEHRLALADLLDRLTEEPAAA